MPKLNPYEPSRQLADTERPLEAPRRSWLCRLCFLLHLTITGVHLAIFAHILLGTPFEPPSDFLLHALLCSGILGSLLLAGSPFLLAIAVRYDRYGWLMGLLSILFALFQIVAFLPLAVFGV